MPTINFPFSSVRDYIDRPGYLVISANHSQRLLESEIPEFLERVKDLKGMKIEGAPVPDYVPKDVIEVFARESMKGKPVEYVANTRLNGDLLGQVYEEYGFPIELAEQYYCFKPAVMTDMRPIRSFEELSEAMTDSLLAGKERCPNIDYERAIDRFFVINQILRGHHIPSFCNEYLAYHGLLIEYEFIQPDILDFRERIEGKIGVLIGW